MPHFYSEMSERSEDVELLCIGVTDFAFVCQPCKRLQFRGKGGVMRKTICLVGDINICKIQSVVRNILLRIPNIVSNWRFTSKTIKCSFSSDKYYGQNKNHLVSVIVSIQWNDNNLYHYCNCKDCVGEGIIYYYLVNHISAQQLLTF